MFKLFNVTMSDEQRQILIEALEELAKSDSRDEILMLRDMLFCAEGGERQGRALIENSFVL